MRPVHGIETPKAGDQLPVIFFCPLTIFCKSKNLVGEQTPCLVLLTKHGNQVGKLIGFFKARKKVVFFQLLMIVFDEFSDYVGTTLNGIEGYFFLVLDTQAAMIINEENTV